MPSFLNKGLVAADVDPNANYGQHPLALSLWPRPSTRPPINEALEARIAEQLAGMTLEEKVGQIIQADIASITPEQAKQYKIGAILNGGNSAPNSQLNSSPQEWLSLVDAFWDETGTVPIIFGTDAVHGHSNVAGATIFPHNINLGAARDVELAKAIGAATAREIAATGMDWTFSPTIAVAKDLRWGRTYEAFSCDVELVSKLGAALIIGLQGEPNSNYFLASDKVACSAKHFLGDGATRDGRDQGETACSEAELIGQHASPYIAAIEAGVTSIMASFSSWGGKGMHGRQDMLTDLLKDHWQFDGLVAGDWNGHGQLEGSEPGFSPEALSAGLDMYMAPDSWKALLEATVELIRTQPSLQPRLDDAVTRMLRLKARLGLTQKGRPAARPLAGQFEVLSCAEHGKLAEDAVRASSVLLKNDKQILPLSARQHILVCGRGAAQISYACGGWTLSWQGGGHLNKEFPASQTLLDGLRSVVEPQGGTVTYDLNGLWETKPDVAIVVLAEEPYAEFRGDCDTLAYRAGDTQDYDMIARLADAEISVVTVLYSGRPLWTNPALNKSSAFVAGFLPGTQAGALANLLVQLDETGSRDFTGRLPFPWPAYTDHFDVCAEQPKRAPLFPLGYGLSLTDRQEWQPLHEVSNARKRDPNIIFDRGVPQGDWLIELGDAAGRTQSLRTFLGGPIASPGKDIKLKSVDFGQQENAIIAHWSGPGSITFQHAPIDLARETNADYGLILVGATEQAGNIRVSLISDAEDGAADGITKSVPLSLAIKRGNEFIFSLKRFSELNSTMRSVNRLVISAETPACLTLAKAYLAPVLAGITEIN